MTSERVQRRIDRLLDQAEEAADQREWGSVLASIAAVLEADPDNQDALVLKRMAEAADQLSGSVSNSADGPGATGDSYGTISSASTEIPTSFADGRYVVDKFLGEGGKKKVYLAHDTVLDRDIAFALIKMEGLDDVGRIRITREAQAMGRLGTHPNVVAVLDIGEHEGQPWMVNELLGGGDVEELIEDAEGPIDLVRSIEIATDTLRGLQFAHEKGIIHRDIKPANVWMTDDGTAKVGDYGLAIATDRSRLTQEKMMVGTVSYMPPEQATGGEITPKADLYSLGAMLYEMVTGRPPFMGDDDIAIIGQHINTPPVAPQWHRSEIPAQLDTLIMRLLSKNPAERPDSAGDVLSALEALDVSGAESSAPGDSDESGSLDSMAGGVFVGRHAEMDQLKAKLENTLSGRGGMVALVGEPGIGKTRTSLELETYAGLRNAQVLWGRCYEGGGAPSYWPWVQAIRQYVASHEPEELRSEMGSTASIIAEIVDEVRDRLPNMTVVPKLDDPESARFRLFDAIATFLKNAAQSRPIVLILDDLHWADKPSLMMLEFISRELASSRVLVVGTYRDMELNRRHPLSVTLGDLTRERLFERVLLRGLTRQDVARFIEMASGTVPSRGLIDAVHSQTEGNPLFVTETIRLLIQEGELTPENVSRSDSSWNIRIPEGVREVIGRRLDRLSERCNEALTIAAVIGRQFTLDQLRVVVEETSESQLLDVIDEALAARTIEELAGSIGEYQFTHALIQETLSGELSTTRRVRMHARIAEALEKLYGDDAGEFAEQLTRHFAEAETVLGPEKVVKYSKVAADRALANYGYEFAQTMYERALRLVDPTDIRTTAELQRGLGAALAHILSRYELQQSVDHLISAFDNFMTIGEIDQAVDTALTPLPHVHGPSGMAHLATRALEHVEDGTRKRAMMLAQMGYWLAMENLDLDRMISAFEEALEIASNIEDEDLELHVSSLAASPLQRTGDFDRSIRLAERVVEIAESAPTPGHDVMARELLASEAVNNGDILAAFDHLDASVKIADRTRNLFQQQAAYSERAGLHGLLGSWDAADKDLQALNADDGLEPRVVGIRSAIQYQTISIEKAIETIELLLAVSITPSAGEGTSIARAIAMRVYADASRDTGIDVVPPELGKLFSETAGLHRRQGTWSRLSYAEVQVYRALMRNDVEQLKISRSEVESVIETGNYFRTRHRDPYYILGSISQGLGELDRAIDEFQLAIERDERIGARPSLAKDCVELSKVLIARNSGDDHTNAVELQDKAIDIATELGMKPLLELVLAQREILKA
jgi:tetratricopeptide (TPR) repeat protein